MNDDTGFTITETGEGTTVTEAGSPATFSVVLNAQPITDVLLSVTSADTTEVTVNPSELTFTSTNWNSDQIVTATGMSDSLVDGDQTTVITISVAEGNGNSNFDNMADQTIDVLTQDDGTSTSSAGDPYIRPVFGDIYKLPDRHGIYRYLSNHAPYTKRFSIDADVVMLTRVQQEEALRFLMEKDATRLISTGHTPLDGYFFRRYMVTNCGEKLLIDTETSTINHQPLQNMTTEHFTVTIGNKQPKPQPPYHKEGNVILHSITIASYHEIYGNIKIVIYKYENPQLRNEIVVHTAHALTHQNTKGFIMEYQDYKQFSIHKLGSKKDIPAFNADKMPPTSQKVSETFHYEYSEPVNITFLQQKV